MSVCRSEKIARSESNARREGGRLHMNAYACPLCDWWHLTAQERSGEGGRAVEKRRPADKKLKKRGKDRRWKR